MTRACSFSIAHDMADVLPLTKRAKPFTYNLPTKTAATFTWTGTPGNGGGTPTSQITGLGGKCVDVAATANGTRSQIWSRTGGANQKWVVPTS